MGADTQPLGRDRSPGWPRRGNPSCRTAAQLVEPVAKGAGVHPGRRIGPCGRALGKLGRQDLNLRPPGPQPANIRTDASAAVPAVLAVLARRSHGGIGRSNRYRRGTAGLDTVRGT